MSKALAVGLWLVSLVHAASAASPADEWRAACGQAFETHCAQAQSAKGIAACMLKVPEKVRRDWHVGCRALIKRRTPAKPRPAIKKKR